jgi:protein-disulfide isomerase
MEEGTALGINSTPTFYLNGKKLANPRSYDEFKNKIEAVLQN